MNQPQNMHLVGDNPINEALVPHNQFAKSWIAKLRDDAASFRKFV
jgi:hypothetical protein